MKRETKKEEMRREGKEEMKQSGIMLYRLHHWIEYKI